MILTGPARIFGAIGQTVWIIGTACLICLVAGFRFAAADDQVATGCIRALRTPHALSLRGKELEMFDQIAATVEAQTRRSARLDEMVSRFAACWGKAVGEKAGYGSGEKSHFGSIGDISMFVDGRELVVSLPEQERRFSVRPDGNPARFAGKVARWIRGAVGDEAWENEARVIVWFLWVESYLDWLGERHNNYVYADELPLERSMDQGKSFGPGFTIDFGENGVVVQELLDESLARLGVGPGVVLMELDGQEITELGRRPLLDYWHRIEPFHYRVRFAGIPYAEEIEAKSVPHRIHTIRWGSHGSIGYVQVQFFADDTPIEFRRLARGFRREGIEGLVIDVRGNPGGRRVLDFIDFFLKPAQHTVSYRELYGKDEPVDMKGSVEYYDYPLVILVDNNSASMSELLAAAIKTNRRGILVGETTSGKGVGQTIHPIDLEGELALVQTVYYYPGTRDTWDGQGIEPDIFIESSDQRSGPEHLFSGPAIPDLERQLEQDPGLREAVRILEEQK